MPQIPQNPILETFISSKDSEEFFCIFSKKNLTVREPVIKIGRIGKLTVICAWSYYDLVMI